MLGKTNIIYVAKDQGSEMQFVTQTIVTRSSSDIKGIKYLNGLFFVFTAADTVLYGEDMGNLEFLKSGDGLLAASNAEYYDGKYFFINSTEEYGTETVAYYVSRDLSAFEQHEISYGDAVQGVIAKVLDIVINSSGQLTFFLCRTHTYKNGTSTVTDATFYICIYDDAKESNFEIRISNSQQIWESEQKHMFMRDRFLFYSSESRYNNKEESCYCITMDATVEQTDKKYYPIGIAADMAYISIGSNTYYSLNFKNYIKARSTPVTSCFLVGGRIGLYNENTVELASKVTDFASGNSTTLDVAGMDYQVLCHVVSGEYTYLGCEGGIIVQCLLDAEGTYQTPEITLIKTLSAKQALSQAQKYTDKKIEELRAYIDGQSG
ncbi:MAG: hypothetical protein NC305_13260 [Lachnospiraceae bacterium]|nr:hypothetical protein [Butyrivibrio sp.]MCM1344034.1 hypothetical protein [Muribaculaceae bacterium]MCM1411499.1 hypothetical protein [Lachnospiraceae bacterium]